MQPTQPMNATPPPAGGFGPPGGYGGPPPAPIAPPPRRRSSAVLVAGVVGALGLRCCGSGIAVVVWASIQAGKVAPLEGVCLGTGVPGAAPYGVVAGVQRLVAFQRNGSGWMSAGSLVPSLWQADTVENAALVMCAEGETDELLERCAYRGTVLSPGNAFLERWGYRRDIRLVEARTGRVLLSTTLRGEPPPVCGMQEALDGTERRHGQSVGQSQVEQAIAPFVNLRPPPQPGVPPPVAPPNPLVPAPVPAPPAPAPYLPPTTAPATGPAASS